VRFIHSRVEKNNTARKNDPSFPFDAESTWTVLKAQHFVQIRARRFAGSQAHPWLADSVANCGSDALIRAGAPDLRTAHKPTEENLPVCPEQRILPSWKGAIGRWNQN
jgi:hypothetical protein